MSSLCGGLAHPEETVSAQREVRRNRIPEVCSCRRHVGGQPCPRLCHREAGPDAGQVLLSLRGFSPRAVSPLSAEGPLGARTVPPYLLIQYLKQRGPDFSEASRQQDNSANNES